MCSFFWASHISSVHCAIWFPQSNARINQTRCKSSPFESDLVHCWSKPAPPFDGQGVSFNCRLKGAQHAFKVQKGIMDDLRTRSLTTIDLLLPEQELPWCWNRCHFNFCTCWLPTLLPSHKILLVLWVGEAGVVIVVVFFLFWAKDCTLCSLCQTDVLLVSCWRFHLKSNMLVPMKCIKTVSVLLWCDCCVESCCFPLIAFVALWSVPS